MCIYMLLHLILIRCFHFSHLIFTFFVRNRGGVLEALTLEAFTCMDLLGYGCAENLRLMIDEWQRDAFFCFCDR